MPRPSRHTVCLNAVLNNLALFLDDDPEVTPMVGGRLAEGERPVAVRTLKTPEASPAPPTRDLVAAR